MSEVSGRESAACRITSRHNHYIRTINWAMPTQRQDTTLITRLCIYTSTKALATLFGACPNSFSLQMKSNIFLVDYHTGILLHQRHAVRFQKSTSFQCPLCQQADSALRILSGCQHTFAFGMITERYNVACRLIMKAISKGSLAGFLVHLVNVSLFP